MCIDAAWAHMKCLTIFDLVCVSLYLLTDSFTPSSFISHSQTHTKLTLLLCHSPISFHFKFLCIYARSLVSFSSLLLTLRLSGAGGGIRAGRFAAGVVDSKLVLQEG